MGSTPRNLALICSGGHQDHHDGTIIITGDPNGELIFHYPNGTTRSSWPAPHTAAIKG